MVMVPTYTTLVVFFMQLRWKKEFLTAKIFIYSFYTVGNVELFVDMIDMFSYSFGTDK
jgi:hypothetical protein